MSSTRPAIVFPALYGAADDAALKAQKKYLRLIKVEYGLLVIASCLSLPFVTWKWNHLVFAITLISAIFAMLTRSLKRPEQDWYKTRALAESVKTMSWRFSMRAEPFNTAKTDDATLTFSRHLQELMEANKNVAELVDGSWTDKAALTPEMKAVRRSSRKARLAIYCKERILDQKKWYRDKSVYNAKMSNRWTIAAIVIYGFALILAIIRVAEPSFQYYAIDPLLVIAASLIGWTQIKKFNELSVAYKVTALEIGLLGEKSENVNRENSLSEFVSEAEQAFSREHTMWVARQTS